MIKINRRNSSSSSQGAHDTCVMEGVYDPRVVTPDEHAPSSTVTVAYYADRMAMVQRDPMRLLRQNIDRDALNFGGNPRFAPADIVQKALLLHHAQALEKKRSAAALPSAVEEFLAMTTAQWRAASDDFLRAFAAACVPPKSDEVILYSGCRHLESAQALVRQPAAIGMYVTPSCAEAMGYSWEGSAVLTLAAQSTRSARIELPYNNMHYASPAAATADGVRVIGVIRGVGPYRAQSVIAGAVFD